MANSAPCQPKPCMAMPASGTTRNCPAEDPAVPNPVARPRISGGNIRVRLAMMVGMPAAETAMPMMKPAKKVKGSTESDSAMPNMPMQYSTAPPITTRRPPKRSASWPMKGWLMPLISTCSPMAKAKSRAAQPFSAVMGARNRPKDWRRPMASMAPQTAQVMTRAMGSARERAGFVEGIAP